MCEHGYYKEDKEYALLYCRYSKGICPFSKKCDAKKQYIQNENYKHCIIYKENEKKKVPDGAYKINLKKFNTQGQLVLYVEKDNSCEKIVTDLQSYDKDYIYIKKLKTKIKVSDKPIK